MGFRDKLREWDLVNDGSTSEKDQKSEKPKAADRTANADQSRPVFGRSSTTPPVVPVKRPTGVVDQGYLDSIRKVIEDSPMPGMNEFMRQLQVLEKVPGMNESTRFHAALAQLGTTGLTLDDVMKSVNDRITILHGQEASFKEKIDERRKTLIGSKEAEKLSTQQQIEAKTRELEALRAKLGQIDAQVSSEEVKLTTATQNFESARAHLEDELSSFLTKLNINLS